MASLRCDSSRPKSEEPKRQVNSRPTVWKRRINIGTLATMTSVKRARPMARNVRPVSFALIAGWESSVAVARNLNHITVTVTKIYPIIIIIITTTIRIIRTIHIIIITITTSTTPKVRRRVAVCASVSITRPKIRLCPTVRVISTVTLVVSIRRWVQLLLIRSFRHRRWPIHRWLRPFRL